VSGETIRMRGTVQGVGFRPAVARVARRLGLAGWVKNDAEGVLLALAGPRAVRDAFVAAFLADLPPLAHVESVERCETASLEAAAARGESGFAILESAAGAPRTGVSPDAATCAACLAEIRDPGARRFGYPFTNCTHCGPRFTIVTAIPYDRQRTTMAPFELCADCRAEYMDEGDRRYHAEPIACPRCGPQISLEQVPNIDVLDAAAALIRRGAIVAVKGLGGYHLCCDATSEAAVTALRERKRRRSKPFALMARDLAAIERLCLLAPLERRALTSPAAPIVLLDRRPEAPSVASGVAPGHRSLGVMLPATPLHHLLMERLVVPIVCTSGNLSEEPQVTDAAEARERLAGIADAYLDHDRAIAQRLDDSVVRLADGAIRVVRRARGFAPAPLPLPPGFERAPRVTALGAQLKGTVCLLQDGHAVLSQHTGDLDDLRTLQEHRRTLRVLTELYEHDPEIIAVDMHPDYPSTRDGARLAEQRGLPLVSVQHHHAHIAACLAEHQVPLDHPPVLGIALDGLGYGDDGTLWGAEFLMASYATAVRVATMKPVALLGGDLAAREPWRSLYAHLMAAMTWRDLTTHFTSLPLTRHLATKPRDLLDQALRTGLGAPLASSCGRLFDAVAAALALHPDRIDDEGQAAIALEQALTPAVLSRAEAEPPYPMPLRFPPNTAASVRDSTVAAPNSTVASPDSAPDSTVAVPDTVVAAVTCEPGEGARERSVRGRVRAEDRLSAGTAAASFSRRALGREHVRPLPGRCSSDPFSALPLPASLPFIDPSPLFAPLLRDIAASTPVPLLAARFHVALADSLVRMTLAILPSLSVAAPAPTTIALSGGVWQNRALLELVTKRLRAAGLRVLVPRLVPANDGGVALGQAVVAAARFLVREGSPCA
jgi:hydrogenase maturation protein HypF